MSQPSFQDQGATKTLTSGQAPYQPPTSHRSYTQYSGYAMPVVSMGGASLTAIKFVDDVRPQEVIPMGRPQKQPPRPYNNPLTQRYVPPGARTLDYVHEGGVFKKISPQIAGSYTVHPDWVSEQRHPIQPVQSKPSS
ncbi:uncharacterized protein LOC131935191 [Physella acuta]|uniref:uncharacterized protein LOC131935191 n=1 Tax=Physella acuta TaxID=109671 RepID=UPI0027DCEF88|nr:uncharacterized protein LOC131935191 [Physella acuta]